MGGRVSKHRATYFLQHGGIGIALTRLDQIQLGGLHCYMYVTLNVVDV